MPRLATEVAQRALTTFVRLTTEQNYQALGFDSIDQVQEARLGVPSRAYMVRLDELRDYDGGDPGQLLHPIERVIYPVEVAGRTRSGLTVALLEGQWQAESFGAPALMRYFTEARALLAERLARPPGDLFEVQVPALNVRFVGGHRADGVALTPIIDDPRFGFESGDVISAEEAFSRLVEAAREHDGLPT